MRECTMSEWLGNALLVLLVLVAMAGVMMAAVTAIVERPAIKMMRRVAAEREEARQRLLDYESRNETLPGRDN